MITKNKLKHHIKHLEDQHREVDEQIEREYSHFGQDAVVTRLKKRKLELKDDIELMKRKLNDAVE